MTSEKPIGRPHRPPQRCGMALYMHVMGTALIVSLLGLTSMALLRIDRRRATSIDERVAARANARSAVEFGLRSLNSDSNWRTVYSHGVESPLVSIGTSKQGTVSWVLTDQDNNIANADLQLRLRGIGRAGNAVQASSVQLQTTVIGPGILRQWNSGTSAVDDDLEDDQWWCQYFKPNLPADANGWWITRVDFWARRDNNRWFRARLYRPSQIYSGGGLIESVDVDSSGLSSLWGWKTINFGSVYVLNAGEAICVAIETTAGSPPIEISYVTSGVSESDTALVRGNPDYYSFETTRALRYRAYGYYTTSSGVRAISGTWDWDAP
jgi:Tfp pilus assembly protein PilX